MLGSASGIGTAATKHRATHSVPRGKHPRPAAAAQILLHHFQLQLFTVLRHEKHPKGRIGVQFLGCTSLPQAVLACIASI
jgi:hypothetical protein